MIREESDAEHKLAVNQRRLGFKVGRGFFAKTATISRSSLKRVDNFIQNDFDRSIRAIVNADTRHHKELGLAVRIPEKIVIIDYLINRNPIA